MKQWNRKFENIPAEFCHYISKFNCSNYRCEALNMILQWNSNPRHHQRIIITKCQQKKEKNKSKTVVHTIIVYLSIQNKSLTLAKCKNLLFTFSLIQTKYINHKNSKVLFQLLAPNLEYRWIQCLLATNKFLTHYYWILTDWTDEWYCLT